MSDTLGGTWLGLLVVMAVLSFAAGHPPSSLWLLAFAVLAIALGVHHIFHREEVFEIQWRQTPSWLRWTLAWFGPGMIAFGGAVFIAWGHS